MAERHDDSGDVREWIEYAEADLRAAARTPLAERADRTVSAYHAQQAAEKALKAFLVHRQVEFPSTHNIRALLELCARHAKWTSELRDAEALSRYAVASRYPGIGRDVTGKEVDEAMRLANQVVERVREALRAEGIEC